MVTWFLRWGNGEARRLFLLRRGGYRPPKRSAPPGPGNRALFVGVTPMHQSVGQGVLVPAPKLRPKEKPKPSKVRPVKTLPPEHERVTFETNHRM